MDARASAAVFGPVAAQSTYEETVGRLGTAIRIGVLTPGTRLPPERELAEQLGISRSTLRQALGTLTESGHLVAVRGRAGGTFVSEAPPIASGGVALEKWRDLLDWRLALEVGVAELAAERADEAVDARLQEDLKALDEATKESWTAYRRADVGFHLALAEATRSARIVAAMTELQGELTDLLDRVPHPAALYAHSNAQHRRIVAAVAKRDAGSAVIAMRIHLEATERVLEGLMP